jgi:AraC-like DNA-binding protein
MDLLWTGDGLTVAGPDPRAWTAGIRAGHTDIGIRFPPGLGPVLLGIRADQLRGQRALLEELWPHSRVRPLLQRFADTDQPGRLLEDLAAQLVTRTGMPDPVVTAVVAGARSGTPIGQLAQTVGISARQMHRISHAAFGYGAKTLAVILRMNRALDLARLGGRPAEVAAVTGYSDQAHLSREVKSLTGRTLGELVGRKSH